MILPNLFVVAAPKSGTTSFFEYLDGHPDVFMCRPKEPMFFMRSEVAPADLQQYSALFQRGSRVRVRGDASVRYAGHEHAADHIRAFVPDARLVFLLRNPVDRAWSHYSWSVARGFETRPFEEAFGAPESWRAGVSPDDPILNLNYGRESSFGANANRFLDVFPAGQTLFLTAEALLRDPNGTVNACLEFAGVSPLERLAPIQANATPGKGGSFAYALLTGVEHTNPAAARTRWLLTPVLQAVRVVPGARRVRDRLLRGLARAESMPAADRRFARAMLESDVATLRATTHESFSEWEADFPRDHVVTAQSGPAGQARAKSGAR